MKLQFLMYGSIYFALVFAAGFILGTLRVLALEPRMGARYAELLEIPLMLFFIYQSARYVVFKMSTIKARTPYVVTGVVALALLLLFEFSLVLGLRGISIPQYFASRDEIAFGAYILSLILFAFMPWIIKIRRDRHGA